MLEGLLQLVGPLMTQRVIDVALPARDAALVSRGRRCCSRRRSSSRSRCQYGETMLTQLLGQRVMRDLRHAIFAHVQRLPDRVLRPQSGRTAGHARDVGRRVAERAVHRRASSPGLGDLFTLARDQRR